MGCGASSAPDDQHVPPEKWAPVAGGPMLQAPSPGRDPSRHAELIMPLEARPESMYTCPRLLMPFRTVAMPAKPFRALLSGFSSIVRPPPGEATDTVLHVRSDLCPYFTVLITEEELQAVLGATRKHQSSGSQMSGHQPNGRRARGLSTGAGLQKPPGPCPPHNFHQVGEMKRHRAQRSQQEKAWLGEKTDLTLALLRPRIAGSRLMSISVSYAIGAGTCVESVALSHDERLIAVALESEVLRPRKAPVARESNQGTGGPRCGSHTPWGAASTWLFHRHDGRLRFYESRTLSVVAQILVPIGQHLRDLTFTPDALCLYSSDDHGITAWDMIKKRPSKSQVYAANRDQRESVFSCISGCGLYVALVVSTEVSHHMDVFREGKHLQFFGHDTQVTAIAFSQDSQHVASSDAFGLILVWRTKDGQTVGEVRLDPGVGPIRSIAFFASMFVVSTASAVVGFEVVGLHADTHDGDGGADAAPPQVHLNVPTHSVCPLWAMTVDSVVHSTSTLPEVYAVLAEGVRTSHMHNPSITFVHRMPCGTVAVARTTNNVMILDCLTGMTLHVCETKAPPTCFDAGFQTGLIGDMWGNVYRVNFEQTSELPRF